MISIHAPVKGATQLQHFDHHLDIISIHAPVKGATRRWRSLRQAHRDFNPRAREGRDLDLETGEFNIGDISIHAPVKGATLISSTTTSHIGNFNPRAREGRDNRTVRLCGWETEFQSTRP